jgi:hypothetical protein
MSEFAIGRAVRTPEVVETIPIGVSVVDQWTDPSQATMCRCGAQSGSERTSVTTVARIALPPVRRGASPSPQRQYSRNSGRAAWG